MPTDADRKINGQPQPWRKPVTWGRPPEQVFRAGPLPRGETLPPLPEPPSEAPLVTRPASSIFSGSMVPQAAPPARPVEPEAVFEQPAPVQEAVDEPDLTVRPLPSAEPDEALVKKPVTAPRDAIPLETSEAPPVVSPALVAATTRRKAGGRLPLYAGGAAVVVGLMAFGGWMVSRPSAPAPTDAGAAAPAVSASPAETTVPAPIPATTAPAIQPPVEAAPAVAAPVTTAARPSARPAAATSRPEPTPAAAPPVQAATPPPAPTITTAPLIEVAPAPAGPAPTAAERPAADPDAPITTRPQPLGE